GELPLPADMAREVLQSFRYLRVHTPSNPEHPRIFLGGGAGEAAPGDLPLAEVPEVRVNGTIRLGQSELGQFTLDGGCGVFFPKAAAEGQESGPYAVGRSAGSRKPENDRVNTRIAADPALRVRVTLRPEPSCGAARRPGLNAAVPHAGDGPEPK